MIEKELVIIGGGPAGLAAALAAASCGVVTAILDRNPILGGQLIKQTHKFFGSEKQYAKRRGFDIAHLLLNELSAYRDLITIVPAATVLAIYPDKVVTYLKQDKYFKVKAKAIIVATGAYEKTLTFENNDLPGIYGAGAVQTLMNVYGIKPGHRVVMVGSGNIGLIVSYQLLQAGVKVMAVLEAAPKIGGYKVHAAKLRRHGVSIITARTVVKAHGTEAIYGITSMRLNDLWQPIPGTELYFPVDALCVAVGLSPLVNLLGMLEVKMQYIPELGGLVPVLDDNYMTSAENVFACGDVAGIEEASSAIVEGRLSGLYAARKLGKLISEVALHDYQNQLRLLRGGPYGEKIRNGFQKARRLEC
ncbi:MAG: FAD-dependent oxidoreductase [Bacilli bacterium]|nr:FAD-dependent oxidoreductase [Bacilli bacterium]